MKILAAVKEHWTLIAFGLVALALIGMVSLKGVSLELPKDYSELKELDGATFSSQEYFDYFRKLAEDKGGEYAFQVLLRAKLAYGTDIHLVAHVIGDVLYSQKGMEGIYACTQDFRNACSHSIVIGVLNEFGEGALDDIAATCRKAPGGLGAYTMCFHGLGHGVLAFNDYKFEDAVDMCKKTGTAEYHDREYIECVGGATMEMMAGVHDRAVWEKEVPNYLSDTDPLRPCDDSYMPAEVQPICYIHLTPHLFEVAGMNLGRPDPAYYAEAFSYCDRLPADAAANRTACFGGFGKEFVVLGQGRDVRDVGKTTEPLLREVREWCALANNEQGETDCNAYALSSLFWGGENTPDASFLFCQIAEGKQQVSCYTQLADNIRYYFPDAAARTSLCERIPDEYRGRCTGGR